MTGSALIAQGHLTHFTKGPTASPSPVRRRASPLPARRYYAAQGKIDHPLFTTVRMHNHPLITRRDKPIAPARINTAGHSDSRALDRLSNSRGTPRATRLEPSQRFHQPNRP